jgi:hypothetical protein
MNVVNSNRSEVLGGDFIQGKFMQDLDLAWDKVLRVAWLLTWRGLFGGLAIGFLLGYLIDLSLGLGLGKVLDPTAGAVLKLVVLLVWWPFVVRMALKKRYSDFRIVLIPHGP